MQIKVNKKFYSKKELRKNKQKTLCSYYGKNYLFERKRVIDWLKYDLIEHGYEDCYYSYCLSKNIEC